jgi:hypothetical protein
MPKHDSKPSSAQLRYLRQLADQTGTSFTPGDAPPGQR